jgi:hypothetical protein
MKIPLMALMCLCFCASACTTDDGEAIRTLDDQGYSDIQIVDRGIMANWEGCDEKDGAWYNASVTNPKGKHVTVLVCCGGNLRFKGCTIRSK